MYAFCLVNLSALTCACLLLLPIPAYADGINLPIKVGARPIRVSCRDENWTFNPGQQVERTLDIFNDTGSAEPIDMEWSLQIGGKAYAEGAETFVLQPGSAEEYSITFRAPPFAKQTIGQLVLTCLRDGQEVFREVKTCIFIADVPEEPLPPNTQEKVETLILPCCLPRLKMPWLRVLLRRF